MNARTGRLGIFMLMTLLLAIGCESLQSNNRSADPARPDTPAWNQLQTGMAHTEVYNLLGPPIEVRVTAVQTTWFYSDRGSDGPRVIFDTPNMTVERSVSPATAR